MPKGRGIGTFFRSGKGAKMTHAAIAAVTMMSVARKTWRLVGEEIMTRSGEFNARCKYLQRGRGETFSVYASPMAL